MAYCKKCGAYIPDGIGACLACGFDENAGKAAAAAKAEKKAARNPEYDDLGEILERNRKLQQEKNRQWAEQEHERRQKQEENRRWAEEEYARRQAQKELEEEQRRREAEERVRAAEARAREAEARAREATRSFTWEPAQNKSGNTALAALSYLSALFLLPLVFTPEDKFARFHAKQGLRLFLFSLLTDVIGGLTGIGWVLSLFRLFCIIKGISNAIQGKKEPLPFIGTLGNF